MCFLFCINIVFFFFFFLCSAVVGFRLFLERLDKGLFLLDSLGLHNIQCLKYSPFKNICEIKLPYTQGFINGHSQKYIVISKEISEVFFCQTGTEIHLNKGNRDLIFITAAPGLKSNLLRPHVPQMEAHLSVPLFLRHRIGGTLNTKGRM